MDETDAATKNPKKVSSGLNLLEFPAAVLIYLTVVAAAYVRFGTLPPSGFGVVAALVVPIVGFAIGSREFAKISVLFVAVLLAYEALQGMTGILVNSGNVVSLYGIDNLLVGSEFVSNVQTAFSSSFTTFISIAFYGLHSFLVIFALVLFWWKDRTVCRGYAYSFALTSYSALLTFVALPTAPPWLAGKALNLLASGDKMLPTALQGVQAVLFSGESDIFAAFPSLHAAYVTLISVFMFKLGRKYGLATLPIAGGVYFSIIYLGQHFLVDLLAGVAYAGISAYVVGRVMNRRHKVRPISQSATPVAKVTRAPVGPKDVTRH
jgi:membrane-associated phospholipid phosphatase